MLDGVAGSAVIPERVCDCDRVRKAPHAGPLPEGEGAIGRYVGFRFRCWIVLHVKFADVL
jgi:hypothetical protein